MKRFVFLLGGLLLSAFYAFSQEGIRLTQYMYNMSLVNPAYSTGNEKVLDMGLLYRAQWLGMKGAPRTYSFFAHTPINDRIEVGGSLIRDNIGGFITEDNALVDFAYKLKLSKQGILSLGLKGGIRSFRTSGLAAIQLENTGDPAFANDINNLSGTFGFGAFFYAEKYYIGVSMPNIIEPEQYRSVANISLAYSTFLTAGYVFSVSPTVKIKPSTFFRYLKNNRYVLDLNTNVLLFDRLELGASYRLNNSLSGLVNFEVLPGLRVGYAYDYSTTAFKNYNSGSHEVMILYNLGLLGKKGIEKSPRFF